jgi:hypothetical protein
MQVCGELTGDDPNLMYAKKWLATKSIILNT